jgi:hypothetical protein
MTNEASAKKIKQTWGVEDIRSAGREISVA